MRFVSVRDLRGRSTWVWRELNREREVVLTSNDKPFAILLSVSEDSLEESLSAIRQAQAVSAVTGMQKRSTEIGTDRITLDEINAEIAEVRKSRRR